jgi:periplasmic mercuric ion binding protein
MSRKLVPTVIATLVLGLAAAAHAETGVTLTGVHLCCKGCASAAQKAATSVAGVTAVCDMKAGSVSLAAPDDAGAQKAAEAIVAAGFFGSSDNPAVKVESASGAPDKKVKTATVTGVHLCCGKCARVANTAAMSVPGITSSDAAKESAFFTVTGDFNARALAVALEKAGLSGKITGM